MRDLGWFPPRPATVKRIRRRRRLRALGIVLLCLGSTAFVMQQSAVALERIVMNTPNAISQQRRANTLVVQTLTRMLEQPMQVREVKWRGKWKGQNALRTLPYDEALEILFDPNAPRVMKGSAGCIVFMEIDKQLEELRGILARSESGIEQQAKRVQEIVLSTQIALQAYAAWAGQNAEGRKIVPHWYDKIAARIP